MNLKSILVVCEGNICRSPMAEAMLASALPAVHVRSAGLGAVIGAPADPIATRLMALRSLDISSHRAVQITRSMCVESDIVLVMEASQRRRLEQLYPQVQGRVFRLGEGAKIDVPDPYRKPESAFVHALAIIDEAVLNWVRRIEALQGKSS